jgi:hypothetical protein
MIGVFVYSENCQLKTEYFLKGANGQLFISNPYSCFPFQVFLLLPSSNLRQQKKKLSIAISAS